MENSLNYKLLQNSPDFKNPKPELEQYITPVDITLEIIKQANIWLNKNKTHHNML